MRFLGAIGALAILIAVAGAIYFFGGYYNVAAVGGGNAVVEWALRSVREASVDQHAVAPPKPDWFGTPQAVEAGAKEFAKGACINCHGGPGVEPAKFAQGMDPNPPDLGHVGEEEDPTAIFWVIKNGIRMTGMPGFGMHAKDEQIWRLVSFIKEMKNVSPEKFKAWTPAGGSQSAEAKGGEGKAASNGGAAGSNANGSSGSGSNGSSSQPAPASGQGGGSAPAGNSGGTPPGVAAPGPANQ
ncbi:cytochrome c [Jiella sp. M17.18]|uniref:c-type cytochrome n=1 Tax=Jiella sp. M17.18 TaxID=3234247 RepID=UPI0034DE47E6